MAKVRQVLGSRRGIVAVDPQTLVIDALKIMAEKNTGGVLITENDKLVGIFTERDYARKVTLKGRNSRETPIGDVMTRNPITVTLDTHIDECMSTMSSKKIRHLPVMENGDAISVISIGDLVKYVISEQKGIIEQLEHYITNH